MTHSEAIQLKNALIKLSDFLGESVNDIVKKVCLGNKKGYERLLRASILWNEFDEAGIEDRAKMLGLNLGVDEKGNGKIEIEL